MAAPTESDAERHELEADTLGLMLCPGQLSYTVFPQYWGKGFVRQVRTPLDQI